MANGVNKGNKKFITKKPRSINNGQLNTNGLTNGTTTAAAANAKHHHQPQQYSQQKHGKLKPVKERRPTALPTEQPTIEEQSNNANTSTNNKAKFFIGTHDETEDDDDDDDDKDTIDGDLDLHNKTEELVDYDPDCSDNKCSPSPNTSLNSKNFDILNAKLRNSKLPSNTSNKLSKFTRTPTNNSTLSQHHDVILEKEVANIPPPPPLPPQPLVVAHSPSILSKKSSKSKRFSNDINSPQQHQQYAAVPTTPTIQEGIAVSRNLTETEMNKAASRATSTTSLASTATTYNGCAKVRKISQTNKQTNAYNYKCMYVCLMQNIKTCI